MPHYSTRTPCVVVTIEAPWPSTNGGRARTAQVITQLASRYDVTVVYPTGEDKQPSEVPTGVRLLPVAASMIPTVADRLGMKPRLGKLAIRAIQVDLRRVLDDIDPAFVYWSHSYLAAVGMKIAGRRLHVVEFANIERERSLSLSRSGRSLLRRVSAFTEYVKSIWWEPKCARQASLVVSLHHAEATRLRSYGAEVILAANGFDQRETSNSHQDSLRVLTMASWTYEPNRAGLESFLNNTWPRILEQNPLLELVIAGRGAMEAFGCAKNEEKNVRVLDYVDDPTPIFDTCFCFLAPALTGGGSQLKVADALSFHRIVVGPRFLQREVTPEMPEGAVVGAENLSQTILNLANSFQQRHAIEKELKAFTKDKNWVQSMAPVHEWLSGAITH